METPPTREDHARSFSKHENRQVGHGLVLLDFFEQRICLFTALFKWVAHRSAARANRRGTAFAIKANLYLQSRMGVKNFPC